MESKVINITPTHSFVYDGATINVFHANKGEGLPKHSHRYDHVTMCNAGSCFVRKENIEVIMDKNTQPINLLAPDWHEIEAKEDGTVFVNIFSEGKY
jgi:quercetin dioxygenase-like cupin family protein